MGDRQHEPSIDLRCGNLVDSWRNATCICEEHGALSGVRLSPLRHLRDQSTSSVVAGNMCSFVGRARFAKNLKKPEIGANKSYVNLVIQGDNRKPAAAHPFVISLIWICKGLLIDRFGSLSSHLCGRGMNRSVDGVFVRHSVEPSPVHLYSSLVTIRIARDTKSCLKKPKSLGTNSFNREAALS